MAQRGQVVRFSGMVRETSAVPSSFVSRRPTQKAVSANALRMVGAARREGFARRCSGRRCGGQVHHRGAAIAIGAAAIGAAFSILAMAGIARPFIAPPKPPMPMP